MPLLKILGVSKLPWMAVVPSYSKFFCQKNLSLNSVHGRTLFNRPAVLFCLTPCICSAYLQKNCQYCVTSQKTVLDVQQVRLRFAFAKLLVLTSPIFKSAVSTELLHKKQSSTYTRYACGTFLPNSLHLLRLFAKS